MTDSGLGLGNIRALIVPDGNVWFAQGLEIDYGAQGDTIQEAKTYFEEGLMATVEQHLKMFGTVRKILIGAPTDILAELLIDSDSLYQRFSSVSFREIGPAIAKNLPFQGIDFYKPANTLTVVSRGTCPAS